MQVTLFIIFDIIKVRYQNKKLTRMKKLIISYIVLLTGLSIHAQDTTDTWFSFFDEESQLIGYKNQQGEVKIEPKFMGLTMAKEFNGIIAVMEEKEGKYPSYYLTKSGRKVGVDSMNVVSNGFDCENEGFIRFRDQKTYKTGMFDSDGNIAIPPVYNEISRVHNGVIWALKGAKKEYWQEYHKESGCNHYRWVGGQHLLINTKNEILIDDFKYDRELDLYSLEIQNEPTSSPYKVSFKSVYNKYYTFVDVKKEFTYWFKNQLLPKLSVEKLREFSMDSITYSKEPEGLVTKSKDDFSQHNYNIIIEKLLSTQIKGADFFISMSELNPFIFKRENYRSYFNTCDEAKKQYPLMKIIINNDFDLPQDHIEFLKTDYGYRYISVTLGSAILE